MNILVLDTETTDLTKCFCYDIGWVIVDSETGELQDMKHYVIEQVWHNLPLFESAYYKDKRQGYVELMRKHLAIMTKWGYAMQQLKRDIKKYNIPAVYAYNSTFDDNVLRYNCDWYKCNNPLDNIPIYDIWGYASQFITNTEKYREFCDKYERYTDTGNYKGSAEVVFQYINDEPEFIESHMGLHDSEIECKILLHCLELGAQPMHEYKVNKILPKVVSKPFTIKINGEEVYRGEYIKKYIRNDVYNFVEKKGE